MTEQHEIPESMLARVQRIVDIAKACEKAGNDADARASYAKADAIMTKWAIDRALIEFNRPVGEKREEPISVTIDFNGTGEFSEEMSNMLAGVVRHNRCQAVIRAWRNEAIIVGFPEDVEYTQMLWAGLILAFSSRINPSWDPERPADENVKILKEAGRKWAYIGELANEHGFPNRPNDGRLKAAYRRQCKREGVEPTPHTQRNEAYRVSYARAFSAEIRARLARLRKAADDQVKSRTEPGTALALRSRSDDVISKFYEVFPHLKPMTPEEKARLKEQMEADRLREELRRASLTDKQRAEEDARNRRQQDRERAQWEREHARTNDRAGSQAGTRAARTVDLGAEKVGTGRKGEIGT